MSAILENREKYNLSEIQLAAHASDFVYVHSCILNHDELCYNNHHPSIAGSETTATALSTITYYLLRDPEILLQLQNDIRTTFKSYEEITASSTVPLKYLHAVVLEGMRIYPPLPLGLPRVVPPGGDTVDGHFLPAGVSLILCITWIRKFCR